MVLPCLDQPHSQGWGNLSVKIIKWWWPRAFVLHTPGAKNCHEHFSNIISNHATVCTVATMTIFRWGNWGSEVLDNCPKFTLLLKSGGNIWIQIDDHDPHHGSRNPRSGTGGRGATLLQCIYHEVTRSNQYLGPEILFLLRDLRVTTSSNHSVNTDGTSTACQELFQVLQIQPWTKQRSSYSHNT